jgi:tetratricopeptide (TPR) repeat protein
MGVSWLRVSAALGIALGALAGGAIASLAEAAMEAPIASGEAPGAAAEDTPPIGLQGSYRSLLEAAWFQAGPDLARRATQARIQALELGVDNLEAAARALMASSRSGDELGRAMLAVRLAPDLPPAHMALAGALWREGEHADAIVEAGAGLAAIPRNLEASFWLAAALMVMFTSVLLVGSFAFIAVVSVGVFSHAAHDLGDLVSREMPAFARAALVASVVLVPLLLGEGPLGLLLVLFAIGFAYGSSRHRMVLVLAAALIMLGMYPMAQVAGTALTALHSDPVADAALSVVRGRETLAEVELLRAASENDELAEHILAVRVRRLGQLEEAHARYSDLHRKQPRDPVILTNLANLRFQRGETEAATDLYERSVGLIDSATLLFNLSQSYARSFRMEEFETSMERAQKVDPEEVVELSRNGDPGFVADLPFPIERIRNRLISNADDHGFGLAVRKPIGPGRLGQSWSATAIGFAAAALLGSLLGGRYEHSSTCSRCGRRICARCDGTVWNSEICDGCHRLFHRPETTDSSLRMTRLTELRARESRMNRLVTLVSLAVPGAGGLLARRPDLGFVGTLFFTWAAVAFLWRDGVVPDPLAVGAAGSLFFLITGGIALVGYLIAVAAGLMIRRSF